MVAVDPFLNVYVGGDAGSHVVHAEAEKYIRSSECPEVRELGIKGLRALLGGVTEEYIMMQLSKEIEMLKKELPAPGCRGFEHHWVTLNAASTFQQSPGCEEYKRIKITRYAYPARRVSLCSAEDYQGQNGEIPRCLV